jgi:hypothetical protein
MTQNINFNAYAPIYPFNYEIRPTSYPAYTPNG